ncbi:aspartate aminotransferase family protein [Phenylobacterium sp.]|jgi:glutamate-1-semialdehyde 2,1-aminomutase|uniref:aspartate aminotransferase family protein n=1 Tax=Phenylobacterium sp. TaxID=1871053 RepID=UPI0037847BCB
MLTDVQAAKTPGVSPEKLSQALDMAIETFIQRNPKSLEKLNEAERNLPGGNTRSVLFYPPFPLFITKGAGAKLWDVDGHEYVDLLGEFTAGIFGHSDPDIRAAIDAALDNGLNLSGHNANEAKLAEAVCSRFPSIDLVRFTNSGTEANVMAVALAKAYTKRSRILVFRGGYHGAVMSFAYPSAPTNLPHDFVFGDYNDAEGAAELIRQNADSLAAVLVEPMLGAGGCLPGTDEFLSTLRAETKKAGALLIFDEVMTSRLSGGGYQAICGITPDLTTLGKYIGGGSSFGAFGGRAEIMAMFDPRRPDALQHAGTFNNNVISMAAGYVGLTKVYTPERAKAHSARGDALRARLNEVLTEQGAPMRVTGIGSLMVFQGTAKPVKSLADAAAGEPRLKDLLFFHLLEEGFYIAKRGFIALTLPTTDENLADFVGSVERFAIRYRDCFTG